MRYPKGVRHSVFVVALVAAVSITSAAEATDYWVGPGGNNGNSGLAPGTAWATLVHAAAQVGPGDTVHVLPGNYQGFYLDTSGTAGNPITFLADGPGVNITSENPITPDGINIEGADYVVIDGFTSNGHTRAGFRAALSNFVTFRNNTAGNNGVWGIFTGFTDDLLVENNETYGSVDEHGIYVSNSCDRPTVRGNLIHDNTANGLHMNGDESQGGDGLIENALVERNVIYGNGAGGGSGINGDGVTNSVIRNNLLYYNHASGISLYRIDGATGATNNAVVNNTVINASDGRWCLNISDGSTGNTVRNNILYNFHGFRGAITIDAASLPGFTSDYNAVIDRFSDDGGNSVMDLAAWQGLGYDANSFVSTPAALFVAPGTDFHLLPAGPAVDAGTASNAPSTDLENNPRPVGGGYDIGAYENQLLECGDGGIDPGEQCGEPGLSCSDPCTSCSGCICALDEPTCGDALVCGSEECEVDGDCSGGAVCSGCQCVNPPLCASGIVLDGPVLKLRANTLRVVARGDALIPLPWLGVDPVANGVHVVIDHLSDAELIDLPVAGGAGWTVNSAGNKWKYVGTSTTVKRVTVRDQSSKTPGLIRWALKGDAAMAAVLPASDALRLSIVLGDPGECASVVFDPPSGVRPRCTGDATKLNCR